MRFSENFCGQPAVRYYRYQSMNPGHHDVPRYIAFCEFHRIDNEQSNLYRVDKSSFIEISQEEYEAATVVES